MTAQHAAFLQNSGLIVSLFIVAGVLDNSSAIGQDRSSGFVAPPVASLARWETQMLHYGELHRKSMERAIEDPKVDPTIGANFYHQEGRAQDRERADLILAGAIDGPPDGKQAAWLDGPKQFNQVYTWSFDFMRWRLGKPLSVKE